MKIDRDVFKLGYETENSCLDCKYCVSNCKSENGLDYTEYWCNKTFRKLPSYFEMSYKYCGNFEHI